jgi:hypothetical protein
VQNFVPQTQPEAATVTMPVGGWDRPATTTGFLTLRPRHHPPQQKT